MNGVRRLLIGDRKGLKTKELKSILNLFLLH